VTNPRLTLARRRWLFLGLRAVTLVVLVISGLVNGAILATFSGATASNGNTFSTGAWINHVQSVGTESCIKGVTSSVVTVTTPVSIGNTVVVRMASRDGADVTPGVSDSAGNAYQLDARVFGNKHQFAVLSARVTTALSASDTITVTHADNAKATHVMIDEFAGLADANRVVASSTDWAKASNTSISAVSPSGRGLALGGIAVKDHRTVAQPGAWSSLGYTQLDCGGRGSKLTVANGYLITSGTGIATYNPSWGKDADYASAIVVYTD